MTIVSPPASTGSVTGRLAGKVAFVTGTAGGMGRSVAQLFCRAGATVYGADIAASTEKNEETSRLIAAEGGTFHAASVDVADENAAKRWIDAGAQADGRVDILYNNAGFAHFAPISEMSQQQWSETLRGELDVIFSPTKAAWPYMERQKGGSIINVASITGMLGTPILPSIAHAAGKGGAIAVTRQYAVEGAAAGIRVNSISPGPVWTPVTRQVVQPDDPYYPVFTNLALLGRVGEPEDIAYAALFLASDEAVWITGINLPVDGGYASKGGVRM